MIRVENPSLAKASYADGFDSDTRSLYQYLEGASGNLAVSGGTLNGTGAAGDNHLLVPAFQAVSDMLASVKLRGSTITGQGVGISGRVNLNGSSQFHGVHLQISLGAPAVLNIYRMDASGFTNIATKNSIVTTAINTDYWLVGRIHGFTAQVEIWTSDPTVVGGAPSDSHSVALPRYSAGTTGGAALRVTAGSGMTYDDLRLQEI